MRTENQNAIRAYFHPFAALAPGAYQIWNDRETVKDPAKRVEGLMSLSRIKGIVMVITL